MSGNNYPAKLMTFTDNDVEVGFRFDSEDHSIWVTAKELARLFEVDYSNIKKHIKNIYATDELEEISTMAKFAIVQKEGERIVLRHDVAHYNFDMILSLGYRINAKRATKLRKWATKILKSFVEHGYVLNEKELKKSPEKLDKLAADIRELRFSEKQVYAKVRDCFRICSTDYNPSSQQVRTFYALLQDKFHYAITSMTSSKLIMDRADHLSESMGVRHMKGDFPTLSETKIGKNYLNAGELYRLHLLSEQFLLFAENTALAKREMTMESLHLKLDELLRFNGHEILGGWQDYLKEEALRHAEVEYELYKKRIKIESLGVVYDEEALAAGEYDNMLVGHND